MKTIFITGASSGFGKETAKLFQSKGWNVIATMRSLVDEQELNLLDNVLLLEVDVQIISSIQDAVEKGIAQFGKIDALLNSAGFAVMGIFEGATEEQIQNQFDVNVFGTMRVAQAILPNMRKNGDGVIVNISSVAGKVGLPFASIYESSKFAVEGFSEALYFELMNLGIKVKIIEPGSAKTNFGNGKVNTVNTIEAYNPLLGKFFENYPKQTANCQLTSPQEVAETIFNAVTDGTKQLRYVTGGDAKLFIDMREQSSEKEYLAFVDRFFK